MLEAVEDDGTLTFGAEAVRTQQEAELAEGWAASMPEPHLPLPAATKASAAGSGSLESRGIYRGYAWYELDGAGSASSPDTAVTLNSAAAPAVGLLVARGSDIVSVYADEAYVGTVVPGGSSRYVELRGGAAPAKLAARVEIWGHSNFDDLRLPSLRLNAGKGLGELIVVTSRRDLTAPWRFHRTTDPNPDSQRTAPGAEDERWPMAGFGGWHPNDPVACEYYRRTVRLTPDADRAALWFDGLASSVRVWVDGREAGTVMPDDPWLWLSPQGESVQLTLVLERRLGVPAGKVHLLEGRSAVLRALSSAEEAELSASADIARPDAEPTRLPHSLAPGQVAWLYAALTDRASGAGRGVRMQAEGVNIKLTAFAGRRLIGRLWLPGGEERPTMRGGSPDSVFIPASWLAEAEERQLRIFAEAVVPGEPGQLQELKFILV